MAERPEVTIAYDPPPGGAAPASAHPVIQFAAGSQRTEDLGALLQKRLRFAAILMALLYTYFGPMLISTRIADGDRLFLVYSLVTWVCEILAAVLLWSRPRLSLRTLRWLELLVVGLPFLHQALTDYTPKYLGDELARQLEAGVTPYFMARAQVLGWFGLVIGYAIVIPNTWRRCLAVVGVIVATAMAANLGAVLFTDLRHSPSAAAYLTEFTVWLAFAVVFAGYNSYRIDALRESAAKARKLGQYRLVKRLGAGGMGEVYLAEHALLRRPCAIKLIRPEHAVDPTALARFEREVQATATLTHPNTVHIYDYGRADDGTFYCAMEYLPGLTLEKLVEQYGPLAPDRAVFVTRQVCAALAEAHAIGLIHRDIKPGNVIVCDRGGQADLAKLLDFGLVLQRAVGDSKVTQEGSLLGTPAYMSPEQADAADRVDARSDIYSFGALLYFLLTGKPPFVRTSAMKTIVAHLNDPVPPPSSVVRGLPADVQAVVLRCLAKKPEGRFQSAAELDAALAACECAGQWTTADAATWWEYHRTANADGSVNAEETRAEPRDDAPGTGELGGSATRDAGGYR